MRGKKPTSYGGRFLAPSVIAFGLVCSEGSAAQDIPTEFIKTCNGLTVHGYRYTASCYSPSANVALANEHLRDGVNHWYGVVDKILCNKQYDFVNSADKAAISTHISAIEQLDTDELDAIANCDASREVPYMIKIREHVNSILDIYEYGYKKSLLTEEVGQLLMNESGTLPGIWTSGITGISGFIGTVIGIRNGAPAPEGVFGSAASKTASAVDNILGKK